jgi:4-amino-4-deoxy-L-arabinose transferase-like glycosyltransferase
MAAEAQPAAILSGSMRRAAARAARRLGAVPLPLRLILAVATLELACWIAFAPPWQAPDEPAHFAYAQHYAEVGDPPSKGWPKTGAGSESTQQGSAETWFNLRTALGQVNVKPLWDDVDLRTWHHVEKVLPPTAKADGYGPNAIAQNPPLYYAYESIPYEVVGSSHILSTVFWMRVWSGLLFLLTIVFTWLAAGELLGKRRWLQALAAGAVALLPELAYMSSVINPDAALATIWTAFTWLALRLVKRGPSPGRVLAVAGVVALSVATHGRGLSLVGPGVVALVVAFARHRRFDWRVLAAVAAGVVVVALALVWAFHVTAAAGGSAYGGEARFAAGGFTLKGFLNYVWQFYFPGLPGMNPKIGPDYGFNQVFVYSFFGSFGSLEVGFPSWVYDWLHTAELAGAVALLVCLWIRRRQVLRSWDVLLVMAATFVSLLFVLHFVAYRDMLGQPGDPVLVGRYVLPLVSLWALGIATVAGSLPRRFGLGLATLVITAGALLQVAGLGLTLTRFYG